MKKSKLIPVGVPWQVSPSVPELRLSVAESEAPTCVRANANILENGNSAAFKRIIISFGRALHARFSPSSSDTEVVPEDDYDWSAVPQLELATLEDSQNRFWREWSETGICPDSGFYEVEGSRWKSEAGAQRKTRHYLILGHDAYAEVLAEGWTWTLEEAKS